MEKTASSPLFILLIFIDYALLSFDNKNFKIVRALFALVLKGFI